MESTHRPSQTTGVRPPSPLKGEGRPERSERRGEGEAPTPKQAWLFPLFIFLGAFSCTAEDPKPAAEEKIPPALTHYKGREIAQTMHYLGAPWLVRESRERQEECSTLLKALNLKPGMVVCDMGAGNGFYTLKIAPLVGDTGKVIAVEIQKEMLDMLSKRAEAAKIANVETVLGTVADPKLAPNSIDLMFCVDVYHEFDHPEEMLAAMRKSLKADGRMVLVEFRAEDPKVPIKPLHKMSKEQILKEILPNGFKLAEQFDKLPWQHVMFFTKE